MKKVGIIFTMLLLGAVSFVAKAQSPADFFVGEWKVVVKGTPSGDAEMVLQLELVDGKLSGEIKTDGAEGTKLSQVMEKESGLTVYFTTMGYDISLDFKKVDDNNLKGSMMGMFDATGERVVK